MSGKTASPPHILSAVALSRFVFYFSYHVSAAAHGILSWKPPSHHRGTVGVFGSKCELCRSVKPPKAGVRVQCPWEARHQDRLPYLQAPWKFCSNWKRHLRQVRGPGPACLPMGSSQTALCPPGKGCLMARQHHAMGWRSMRLLTSSAQGPDAGQPFSPVLGKLIGICSWTRSST